ncbi:MAG: hypothetical protein ABSC95_00700 [Acetobacteraceae bacterium]|jgi:hypothetical protein
MKPRSSAQVLIPPGLAAELQAAADEEHRSAAEVARDALEGYLEARRWRLRRRAKMNESIMARRSVSPVMPTKVGIHDFAALTQERRGWRAFARHDEQGADRAPIAAVILAHRLSADQELARARELGLPDDDAPLTDQHRQTVREKIAQGVRSLPDGKGTDGEAFFARMEAEFEELERHGRK